MTTTDTLCFGDADGVTRDPFIDGLTDYDFLPFNEPAEPGYTMGSRMTYEGGSLPRVIFQGVRSVSDNQLVLGFMCRFDTSFDEDDTIVIVLRTSAGTPTPRRMIVITPNSAGVGANEPADSNPAVSAYQIRRAHALPPENLKFYKEGTLDVWEQFSPTQGNPGTRDPMGHKMPGTGSPGIIVRSRSWLPGRMVGMDPECCWSVEVSMPRDGSGGWIPLNDDFGLYFSVIRTINPGNGIVQSVFPVGAPIIADTPGVSYPDPAVNFQWGHGLIPDAQTPKGSNTGVGVHFLNGWQSVGRRSIGSGTTTLDGAIKTLPAGNADNELVAFIQNTGEGPSPAADISAEFRFANWGLPNAWDVPSGLNPNPTAATTVAAAGGTGHVASPWKQVPSSYVGHEHQCMTVQLSSPHNVNFNQSAVRRNMDFVQLSEITRTAEVSGENYPDPPSGAHEFLLETFCRQINVQEFIREEFAYQEKQALVKSALESVKAGKESTSTSQGNWKNSVIYLWITVAYRRTGTFTTLNGTTYENLDQSPGAFGLVAYHDGLQDKLSFSFDGPGLVQYAPGSYGLKVPHKGRTNIDVMLSAGGEHRGGDVSTKVPKAPWPKPGTLGPDQPDPTPDLPKGCLAALFGLFGKKA